MKKIVLISYCFLFLTIAKAQDQLTYKTTDIKTPLGTVVDFNTLPNWPEAHIITIKAAPSPLSDVKQKKQLLDQQRAAFQNNSQKSFQKTGTAIAPQLVRGFNGNVTQGTPNDNDFSISNGGTIVSVVNTNMNIYNDTGKYIGGKTLTVLGSALGKLDRTFDPRTIYDPETDRFIVVFLQGSTHLDTRIIIAFSQTNDPAGKWNLYQLPGNITGDSSWSDYPILGLSKDELFITVNRVKDNTPWQVGFLESYIWQVPKAAGYAGDTLPQRIYHDIKFGDKPVWSVCPAKGGSKLYASGMHFLSHRPSDLSNDTVFVHYISNTIQSGNAKLSTYALKNSQPYGLMPNAFQPNGKKLQTNDARVLSAMYEDGMIYYVGNTIDQNTFSPAVYFGRIADVWSGKPVALGQIISSDTMDFGYPSISYTGLGIHGDHGSMITFSHVSKKSWPGTSVVYVDNNFNVSQPVMVKPGEGSINLLGDSVDRWGDYTGNQRKYNELGVAWFNGSWGTISGQNRTWIAKVKSKDPYSGLTQTKAEDASNVLLYPNPANAEVKFEFEAKSKQLFDIEIMDVQGRFKQIIAKELAKPGLNRLTLSTDELPNGMYFVNLLYDGKIVHTHKFLVQH